MNFSSYNRFCNGGDGKENCKSTTLTLSQFRRNTTLETHLANWLTHDFKSAVWQMQHAINPLPSSHVKRNILGNFIGGVTGLVTHDELTVEHNELKETQGQIKKILNHQINIKKMIDKLSRDMVSKAGVITWVQNMKLDMEYHVAYQSKKVITWLVRREEGGDIVKSFHTTWGT